MPAGQAERLRQAAGAGTQDAGVVDPSPCAHEVGAVRRLECAEEQGCAAPVLLRALEPTHGLDLMRSRRGLDDPRLLCAGPGRLTQALGVTGEHNGADLTQPPFALVPPQAPVAVDRSPRIGITKAVEKPWRYVEAGSSWSSRARRAA